MRDDTLNARGTVGPRAVAVAAATVVVLAGGFAGVALADDDWPDRCVRDGFVRQSTGVYSGELDGSADTDVVHFEMDGGEYVTMAVYLPGPHESFRFDAYVLGGGGTVSVRNADLPPGVSISGTSSSQPGERIRGRIRGGVTGERATWQLRASEDVTVCVELDEEAGADFPYRWEVSLNANSPERNPLSRVAVQRRLEDRDRLIENLTAELDERTRQVDRLRERVTELEQEVERLDDENVTIDVTVRPGDGAATFREGGTAVVDVASETATLSDVRLALSGQTYSPGADGRVEVPLDEVGRQSLRISYRNATEVVDLDVAARTTTTTTATETTTTTDTTTTTEGQPGFGVVGTLAGLAVVAFALRRT